MHVIKFSPQCKWSILSRCCRLLVASHSLTLINTEILSQRLGGLTLTLVSPVTLIVTRLTERVVVVVVVTVHRGGGNVVSVNLNNFNLSVNTMVMTKRFMMETKISCRGTGDGSLEQRPAILIFTVVWIILVSVVSCRTDGWHSRKLTQQLWWHNLATSLVCLSMRLNVVDIQTS